MRTTSANRHVNKRTSFANWKQLITPNQLTFSRVAALPPLLVLLYLDAPIYNWAALVLFILAGLTDIADGRLARASGRLSQEGKLLDPLADKLLVVCLLVSLVGLRRIEVLPVILILARDLSVSVLRQIAALKGWAMAASKLAKTKTVIQMVAVGTLLVSHRPLGLPTDYLGRILLWISALLAILSGLEYWFSFQRARQVNIPKNKKND